MAPSLFSRARPVPGALAVLALVLSAACGPATSGPPGQPAPAPPAAAPPAAAGAPAPTALPTLSVADGMLPPAAFQWAAYVAQDKGFFSAQALDVDTTQIGTPNEAARAVVSSSVAVAHFSVDAAVRAIEAGGDLVVVGSEIANPAFALIVQPEIRDYADLRGKSLAVSTPKDGAAVVLRLMMRAKGLGDADYDFLSVGTTPNRYAALKSRQADGAIMTQPLDFTAIDDGYRLLGRSSEVLQQFMFMSVSANRTWAQENRAALTRYMKALGGAIDWLYDPANKEAAIDVLVGRTKAERDAAARTYTVYVEEGKVLPRHAEVPMAGLEAMLQAMIELGDLPGPTADAARYVDPSFVAAARS